MRMSKGRLRFALAGLAGCLMLAAFGASAWAEEGIMRMAQWLKLTEHQGTIAPETKITMRNWRQYREFMPPGMIALFEGKYFWKMPQDVEMDVGPTLILQPSKYYLEATGKYARQVQVVHLPDGGTTLDNYVAGRPFPSPNGPDAGWEVIADLWYTYAPHLLVATPEHPASLCTEDRFFHLACTKTQVVDRSLAYNTDPGIPRIEPQASGACCSQWLMVTEPEQSRYLADLTVFWQDPAKREDNYVFVPSLRRSLRLAVSARCAPLFGTDMTHDDQRAGFNMNLTEVQAKLLGVRRILAQTELTTADGKFPENYDMPLGWAKPSWGPWELRTVYVVAVRKIPAKAAGYCYGRRIIYVDAVFFHGLWEELYDSNLKLWKIVSIKSTSKGVVVPNIGEVGFNGQSIEQYWDVQNDHASHVFTAAPDGSDLMFNELAPKQYDDIAKYSTPGGLMHIMR